MSTADVRSGGSGISQLNISRFIFMNPPKRLTALMFYAFDTTDEGRIKDQKGK